ncbi:hypothetical protein HUU42_12090 [bacterium]|nr:hypothetical protein [bacterium]
MGGNALIKVKSSVFELIQVNQLLELSYFYYHIIDVAYRESLLVFEMAVRQRCRQLFNITSNKSLEKLIDKCIEENLFVAYPHNIHALRKLRNSYFHPNRFQMTLGSSALNGIYHVVDTIVDLYHSSELHKERIAEESRIQSGLTGLEGNGIALEIDGNVSILHRAELCVFDNRLGRHVYHFIFWPIFEAEWKDNSVDEGSPIVVESSQVELSKNQMNIFNESRTGWLLRVLTHSEALQLSDFKKKLISDDMSVIASYIEMEISKERWKARKEVLWPNAYR